MCSYVANKNKMKRKKEKEKREMNGILTKKMKRKEKPISLPISPSKLKKYQCSFFLSYKIIICFYVISL